MRIPEKKLQPSAPNFFPSPSSTQSSVWRQKRQRARRKKSHGEMRSAGSGGGGGSGGQLAPIPNLRRGGGDKADNNPGAARACAEAAPGGRGAEGREGKREGARSPTQRSPDPAEPRRRLRTRRRRSWSSALGSRPLPPHFSKDSTLDSPSSRTHMAKRVYTGPRTHVTRALGRKEQYFFPPWITRSLRLFIFYIFYL